MRDLQELVDGGDVAGLLIAVDRLCAAREWTRLVELAERCTEAVERGLQLWPVAMHIDYRLAWEAPAAFAAGVLRPGAGRFALGPLTEVAASTHDWADLAPHLRDPASAAAVAQERVVRGEDLRGQERNPLLAATELPLALAAWEPDYALPRYRDRSAQFPPPPAAAPPNAAPCPQQAGAPLGEDDATRALEAVVEAWVAQSAGRSTAVAVEGDAAVAVGCLSADAALAPLTAADGLAVLQWAGASGGAYGRRRGGAAGRFAAWWAATALAGLDWPPDEAELGDALGELRWYRWTGPGAEAGWVLRIAVEDPVDGLAWAVDATDQRADDEQD